MARRRASTNEAARPSLERVMHHELAARVMRNNEQLLLARACMLCIALLPQRLAGGLDGVNRMHAGACMQLQAN